MKKLLALILADLALSLVACGGDSGAEVADLYNMYNACFENVLSAKQTYCGKALEIKSDSIIFTIEQIGITVF